MGGLSWGLWGSYPAEVQLDPKTGSSGPEGDLRPSLTFTWVGVSAVSRPLAPRFPLNSIHPLTLLVLVARFFLFFSFPNELRALLHKTRLGKSPCPRFGGSVLAGDHQADCSCPVDACPGPGVHRGPARVTEGRSLW